MLDHTADFTIATTTFIVTELFSKPRIMAQQTASTKAVVALSMIAALHNLRFMGQPVAS